MTVSSLSFSAARKSAFRNGSRVWASRALAVLLVGVTVPLLSTAALAGVKLEKFQVEASDQIGQIKGFDASTSPTVAKGPAAVVLQAFHIDQDAAPTVDVNSDRISQSPFDAATPSQSLSAERRGKAPSSKVAVDSTVSTLQ